MTKPVVYYDPSFIPMIRVGSSVICVPWAHPSSKVTGDGHTMARTSAVVAHDALTGEFWTQNTHYKPRPAKE